MQRTTQKPLLFAAVLSLAGITAILFSASGTNDIQIWERWISLIQQSGLIGGYAQSVTDYPPGAFVILAAVTILAQLVGVFVALKLSLIACLMATALIVGLWTRRTWLGLAIYAALLLNAVGLAYLDVYTAPLLLLALWAVSRHKWAAFSALYFCTCLIKWQPLIVAPFFAVYMLQEIGWQRAIRAIGPELVGAVLIGGYFGLPILISLHIAGHNATLSGNALNMGWLASQAGVPRWYPLLAKVAFMSAYSALLIIFLRQRQTYENLLRFALLAFFTYFSLNVGVHENHLYTVLLLATGLYIVQPDMTLPAMAILANANLIAFYGFTGQLTGYPPPIYMALAVLFVSSWVLLIIRGLWPFAMAESRATFSQATFNRLIGL